jgi:solute carrier family 35 protein E3
MVAPLDTVLYTTASRLFASMTNNAKHRVNEKADAESTDQEQQPLLVPQPFADDLGKTTAPRPAATMLLPAFYGMMNLVSVIAIVVANKLVLYTYNFRFAVTLTWLHTIVTACGMKGLAAAGLFQPKPTPLVKAAPIAAVYVLFIVLNNLSLQMNTVGFYQVAKIAVTPTVIAIEFICYQKTVSRQVAAATALLLVGIAFCTVAEKEVGASLAGVVVAITSVSMSALYQVWTGAKQKELELSGLQLLHAVAPIAVALLAVMIPILEPVGFADPKPGTILGYSMTATAAGWILISSVLGLMVTASTFLFIGATSALTYNVVGHLKTIGIVAAGVFLFGDSMEPKKLMGLVMAMTGIVWYSHLKLQGEK